MSRLWSTQWRTLGYCLVHAPVFALNIRITDILGVATIDAHA